MYDFSKKNRLLTKAEFQAVFDDGKKIRRGKLLLFYRRNQLTEARLGIIVPKQYVRLAHQRNKLKRICRESFRAQKEIIKGLDILLLIRSECTPLDKIVLKNDINELWQLTAASLKTV